ncbi:chromatin remodeling complex subunit (actin) [Zalerion maritima]|uniref:Chromatin remodeling complex subunit (Actin) n=1 Tax=Zalerion maritima TaxID=339359 RepID=A0AAD5RJ34_9PEZI|nr:chromatin remodeling complex subunit (actin) [Zalerion maritima]
MARTAIINDISILRGPAPKDLRPPTIYPVKEAKFDAFIPEERDGYEKAQGRGPDTTAIVIDNGSSTVRAGWSFESAPRLNIPPIMAKYRDRKLGRTFSFVGRDCYADTTAKGHIRNAFEQGTGIVSNWDVMEHVLDYVFIKMGLNGVEGGIDQPIVMTEAPANFGYSRKSMTEIVFECYNAPSLAYGIDSLFSFRHNKGNTGLVVSSSYSSTHVIPVYNHKAILSQSARLNWGGWHAAEYLLKLMRLKYPAFPGKLTSSQCDFMLRDHCYVSTDYNTELKSYLDWTGLEDRDVVIQYPYVEEVIVQKSEEELARITERKKESGRRLQEQAAKMRLEKLMQKEQELDYYKDLQRRIVEATNKKEVKRLLDAEDLKDESRLEKMIKELDKKIRKQRTKDVGGDPEEENEEPAFDLLEIPDEELDDDQLKTKKHQKLLKSNHEARARAKAEKEAEKTRVEDEKRMDRERRENDLDGWLDEKKQARAETLARIKERDRLTQDLGNRKSLASQIRMKSIANLASDAPPEKRKRRRGGDDDDFGANDDDWGVYRQIAVGPKDPEDEDEEEDLDAILKQQEEELLEHDPDFLEEHTHGAQNSWSRSLLHAFERGPWAFDGSQSEMNQIHLNVERIRVPEVVFQTNIAGVDQAGLGEIISGLVTQRLGGGGSDGKDLSLELLKDVFLTGGLVGWKGFDERVRDAITPLLEDGLSSKVGIRRAGDAVLDAWKGAAGWVGGDEWKGARVTREEYQEKGGEYLKKSRAATTSRTAAAESTRPIATASKITTGHGDAIETETTKIGAATTETKQSRSTPTATSTGTRNLKPVLKEDTVNGNDEHKSQNSGKQAHFNQVVTVHRIERQREGANSNMSNSASSTLAGGEGRRRSTRKGRGTRKTERFDPSS